MRSWVTPKNGMRKNPAHSVPTILQTVQILPIFHTTAQELSKCISLIFVTIGESIQRR